MRKKIACLWMVLFAGAVFCFSDSIHQTLFEEAQTAYQNGNFKASLEKFLKLNQSGFISPEIYYNIANSYYKLGQLGKAILFYERARDVRKRDADIRANLAIAQKQIKDRWEKSPKSFLQTVQSLVKENFSLWELTFLNVVLLWTLLILASLNLLGKKYKIIRLLFILLLPLVCVCSISLFSSWEDKRSFRAILTEKKVLARSGPGKSFPVTLPLHEGASLRVIEQNGNWSKVLFPDDTIGWVKSKTYEFL